MAKYIYYQILANTLIFKFKQNENISVYSSYWYSINGRGVINICLAPGPYANLNSTCGRTMEPIWPPFWPRSTKGEWFIIHWLAFCFFLCFERRMLCGEGISFIFGKASKVMIYLVDSAVNMYFSPNVWLWQNLFKWRQFFEKNDRQRDYSAIVSIRSTGDHFVQKWGLL